MNETILADRQMTVLDAGDEWRPDAALAFARFEERRERMVRVRRNALRVGAVAAAAAVAVLVIPAPRAAAQRALAPCVDACEALLQKADVPAYKVTRVMAALRAWTGGVVARQVGIERKAAPAFSLKDANGRTVQLADFKGQVVLLNFWATWCFPCKAEMPWFVEFERQYKDRGFAVIGVSMDEDGWRAVKPFLDAKKVNYPVAIGDAALCEKYGGVESLPETLLIDRDGRIAVRHVGLVGRDVYEADILRLLAEK